MGLLVSSSHGRLHSSIYTLEQAGKELSIRSYNNLLCQHVRGFGKRQIVAHPAEVATILFLLHSNCFEEERLAIHIHFHDRELPLVRRDLGLFNVELAPLLQMP